MAREINHHNAKWFRTEWDGRTRYHKITPVGRDDDRSEFFNFVEAWW
jgi:hypothetical protein